jgi:hypothetical protein
VPPPLEDIEVFVFATVNRQQEERIQSFCFGHLETGNVFARMGTFFGHLETSCGIA